MSSTTFNGNRSRLPMNARRTPFAAHSSTSDCRYCPNRDISPLTSAAGRFQLSAEKAYNVSAPIPKFGAASIVRLTALAP
jgi:hypothetical protein